MTGGITTGFHIITDRFLKSIHPIRSGNDRTQDKCEIEKTYNGLYEGIRETLGLKKIGDRGLCSETAHKPALRIIQVRGIARLAPGIPACRPVEFGARYRPFS